MIYALLTLIITLLLGLIAYLIYHLVNSKDQQIDQLQSELDALIQRKRQTGPTMAGLEDMAAQLTNLKLNREIEDTIITACLNSAQQLRQGPYAYDPDKQTGTREEYK